ncbi:MAG: hypothetical protein R2762_07585 [Bryobacteraceae bacterium]
MHAAEDLLNILFRRWRIAAILFSGVVLAFGAYLALAPRVFDARVRFLLKKSRTAVVAAAQDTTADVSAQMSDSEAAAQIATEIQLLQAQPVLRVVALRAFSPDKPGDNSEQAIQLRIEELDKRLKIGPVLRSNLIDVQYSDTDPARALRVVQVLTEEYLNRHLMLRGGKESYDFFASQADQFKAKLQNVQREFAAFQADTEIVALREQKDLSIRTLADSVKAESEAEALRAELEKRAAVLRAQIEAAPPRIGTTLRNLPNQYSVERLNTLLVELANRRTELLAKFRPDDRMVLQIDKQIAQTRTALDNVSSQSSAEQTSDVNPLRQQAEIELTRTEQALRGAAARAETLARQNRDNRAALKRLALAGPREADLVRRLTEAEQNYSIYAKKRDMLRVDGLLDQHKIANVVVAEPPLFPTRPRSRVPASLAALFVLINGGILFGLVGSGYFSPTFALPRELEKFSGVPVLGTVAKITRDRPAQPYYYLNPIVERMRSLATAHGSGATFCIAGVTPGDDISGVSRLIASELAASTRSPVLLVPATAAEPDGPPWVAELPVLEDSAGVAVALRPDAVAESNGLRLDWVWLGIPSEGFSYVLVESRPVDGAAPLAAGFRHAQGVFLVATADQCRRTDVARSMRLLRGAGCEPAGFLLRDRTYPIPEAIHKYL